MKRFFITCVAIGLLSCGESQISEQSEDTAVYAAPVAEDCSDAMAMERIRKATSIQSVTDMTDEEVKEWLGANEKPLIGLQSFELDTLYNDHCVMSIAAIFEWQAAYPTGNTRYYSFDKRDGGLIKHIDILDTTKVDKLVKLCDDMLQQIVADGRNGLTAADGLEEYNQIIEADPPKFTVQHLGDFYLKEGEVTFVYHFAFPHVVTALEPVGDISFSWQELKPYIKKDGPLAFVLDK